MKLNLFPVFPKACSLLEELESLDLEENYNKIIVLSHPSFTKDLEIKVKE